MAQLQQPFDHQSVEPAPDNFELIPPGLYPVEVMEADEDASKSGNGRILKLTLRIIEGDFENRRIWVNLNYIHDNATAQRIAQEQIAALCAAIGLESHLEDTDQLIGIPMMARIKIDKGKDANYPDRNGVGTFKPYENAAPPAAKAAPRPAQAARPAPAAKPAAAAGSRPWPSRAAR